VIETGNDEKAPVILGRPFLKTSGAVIYASATKIHQREEGDVFIQEQDYTNPRATPT